MLGNGLSILRLFRVQELLLLREFHSVKHQTLSLRQSVVKFERGALDQYRSRIWLRSETTACHSIGRVVSVHHFYEGKFGVKHVCIRVG